MAIVKHNYKLKDGTVAQSDHWYYRFTYKGQSYLGSTETANRKIAEQIEKKKRDEAVTLHRLGVTAGLTLEAALNNYIDATKDNGEAHHIQAYCRKLLGQKQNNRHGGMKIEILKVGGINPLKKFEDITDADIQKLVFARKKEGNSVGTILKELSTLSQAIKLNKRLGYPYPQLDFAELKKENQLRPPKGNLRYLSEQEFNALIAELQTEVPSVKVGCVSSETILKARQDVHDITILFLGTGARYSEIAQLKWSSVDMQKKNISLYRSKTKNESMLMMTDDIAIVMQRRLDEKRPDQTYVFEAKDGGPRKYAAGAFNRACKRAGLEGVSFHKLRHTTASWLVQRGVPLYDVSQILGHTTTTMTARYAHLVPSQSAQRAVNALNLKGEAK